MSLYNTMKKAIMISLMTTVVAIIWTVSAQNVGTVGWGGSSFLNNWNGIDRAQGIDIAGAGQATGESGLMDVVRKWINYALGLLVLIAFARLLWGGYKMVVSSGDDEAYKEAVSVMKNSAIGLAIIGLAWIVVQFIFAVIGMIAG